MSLSPTAIDARNAIGVQTAAGLHERLRAATVAARDAQVAAPVVSAAARRRVPEAAIWKLLHDLPQSGPGQTSTMPDDRALQRILVSLLDHAAVERPVPCPAWRGRVLVIRSGPWPVLRTLLDTMTLAAARPAVTVLCHRRDGSSLQTLSSALDLGVTPLFYPRFEPFNRVTLERMLAAKPKWRAAVAIDAARNGSGRALEHVTSAVLSCAADRFVWNASGQLYRVRSLKDTLGREQYDLVRRLLRWYVARRDQAT